MPTLADVGLEAATRNLLRAHLLLVVSHLLSGLVLDAELFVRHKQSLPTSLLLTFLAANLVAQKTPVFSGLVMFALRLRKPMFRITNRLTSTRQF